MPDLIYDQKFKGRDFLSLYDYTQEELLHILDVASDLKAKQKAGIPHPLLAGKTLAMIFTKASTRTRVSFEVAMYQLGGHALFLSGNDLQIGRGEPVADTARVLSRYVNGIMIRTYAHQEVLDLACYADIPVINGLTDLSHPCQVMADFLTIQEQKGSLKGLKLTYVGDGNNMVHSLLLGGAKLGMDVSIACPAGYEPDPEIVRLARESGEANGSKISIHANPKEAAQGADVLYTDVWASMGQEQEAAVRAKAFAGYQINEELLALAKPEALVMHCLPAHRGEEITAGVIEGPQSVVWDEAENRLHIQKAILALLL